MSADDQQLRAIERFVYLEARLADEHRYADWEALWTDDAVYWVPAGQLDGPGEHMSIISDNRHRLGTRIKQLESGRRYAQSPPSRLRRTVSNIEIMGTTEQGDLEIGANFVLVEGRERGSHTFAGRITYHLRPTDDGYAMAYKLVDLVDREWAQPSIAFLI